jgi:ABC-2 type transport system ATP-binding protein
LKAKLGKAPGVRRVEWQGAEARVHVERAERALPALLHLVEKQGAALESMDLRRPTLEDVFLATTGHALRDQP